MSDQIRPAKRPDEEWEAFLERLGAWEATPEGSARVALDRAAAAEGAKRGRADQRQQQLSEARIPERYWFMDVADPHETDAVKALRVEVPGILVLSGSIGCGKTAAACWWLTRAPGSCFTTAGGMSQLSKWGDEIKQLTRASRLCIDDLGVEFADEKGFFVSMLDGILNERYARARPTVITTNLSPPDFSTRYKGRIVDRVNEFAGFKSISGGSLRGKKQLGLLTPVHPLHE